MKFTNYLNESDDRCPDSLKDNKINVKNHLNVIKNHALGPADPRQSNMDFWENKAKKWKSTEGDARSRLCSNCEHYLFTSEIQKCIDNGPAKDIKASALPITPGVVTEKWADVESKPVAWCMLYDITCSPTRTCDSQEYGGPIDNIKARALDLVHGVDDKKVNTLIKEINDSFDVEEYKNPFEDR